MLETIKSYLVSLGFAVDNKTYGEATKAIDKVGEGVAKFAGTAVTRFAVAEAAVVAFVAATTITITKFISSLGEAQIANEKLARQMWISEDSAMAFSSTLKALHANLQDLYLSPTLAAQFQELMKEANSLRPPDEFKNQMKLVQSITFEFKRMRLEATYALQWIGYYFIKYMQGPILQIKLTLAEINDIIIKTMPHWTKVVAQVMSWFARMGITTVRAIKDIIRVFDDIGKAIPKNVKLIAGAIAGLALIIETGPIGIITAILVAAILLLDDFYTYLDGGESAFGPFWKKLTGYFKDAGKYLDEIKVKLKEFFQTLQDNGTIDSFVQAAKDEFDALKDIFETLTGWIKQMYKALQDQGALNDMYNNLLGILKAVGDLENAISGLIKKLLELDGTKSILKGIGDILTDIVLAGFKDLNDFLKSLADGISAIAKLFKGDFKGAWKSFKDSINDFLLKGPNGVPYGGASYMYPSYNTQTNQKANVSVNPTYNIYGSDPRTTLDATHEYTQVTLLRSMRGVFS